MSEKVSKKDVGAVVVSGGKFAIEKGIPLAGGGGGGRNSVYPFAEMEPGDSFFVPHRTAKSLGSVVTARNRRGKKDGSGKRFSARTVDGGVRVWRVA